MSFTLLLAGLDEQATAATLGVTVGDGGGGSEDVRVSFKPPREDALYTSAKAVGGIVYRIVSGEGWVTGLLTLDFEVSGTQASVAGRSSELLLVLASLTTVCQELDSVRQEPDSTRRYPSIAATGIVHADGSIGAVDHIDAKVAAALQSHESSVIFVPRDNFAKLQLQDPRIVPVAHLDEALAKLGIVLDRVYLREPFRGLECFRYEHRAIFYGRDVEVKGLVEKLLQNEARGQSGVMVLGSSGCGKSSFLQAGMLPALTAPSFAKRTDVGGRQVVAESHRAIWRPRDALPDTDESSLAASIWRCWGQLPAFHTTDWNEKPPGSLKELASKWMATWNSSVLFVWVIDQFEELLTDGFAAQVIEHFGELLQTLQSQKVWVLTSLRSDLFPQLGQNAALWEVFGESLYWLEPMGVTALEDVITKPAEAAGLTFGWDEDHQRTLDRSLRADAQGGTEILPLLEFTLAELYGERQGNELTYGSYKALGGLRGAIASRADALIGNLEEKAAAALMNCLGRLVRLTVNGEGVTYTRATAQRDEFTEDDIKLMEPWVDARLLVRQGDQSAETLEVAHESLIKEWVPLKNWLEEYRAQVRWRQEFLAPMLRQWQASGQPSSGLLPRGLLKEARKISLTKIALPSAEQKYLERSARRLRWQQKRAKTSAHASDLIELSKNTLSGSWEESVSLALEAHRINASSSTIEWLRVLWAENPCARGVLCGHENVVFGGQFSPTGEMIVTASHDGTARLWSAKSGHVLHVLRGHEGIVNSARFSPTGEVIVTASHDGTARLWSAISGRPLQVLLGHEDLVICAQFSPNGETILTASYDGTARLWSARSGQLLQILQGHEGWVYSAQFSPNGETIVTSSHDCTARLWCVESGQLLQVLQGHEAPVESAQFSPSGKLVVTAGTGDRTARLWSARTGKLLQMLQGHEGHVTSAQFSPNGEIVVTASWGDRTARLWCVESGESLRVLRGHGGEVNSAQFNPSGEMIVTASFDGTARLWCVESGQLLQVLRGHRNFVFSAQFSPSGDMIVTASISEDAARLWCVKSGLPLQVLRHEGWVYSAQFSPTGETMVTSSHDCTARLWCVKSGLPLQVLRGHEDKVNSAQFSPTGETIVTSSHDCTARLWCVKSGLPLQVLRHEGWVYSAQFSPTGETIVTSSHDCTARLWCVKSGLPLQVLRHEGGVYSTQFSPNGETIVTGADIARLWCVKSGRLLQVLRGHESRVIDAQFSPDGDIIVTAGGDDRTARLWCAKSGLPLRVLWGHKVSVNSAQFSPDGEMIVTAATDGTACVWSAASGRLLQVLRGHESGVNEARFSPNGETIVIAGLDGTARLWSSHVCKPVSEIVERLYGSVDRGSITEKHARFGTISAHLP